MLEESVPGDAVLGGGPAGGGSSGGFNGGGIMAPRVLVALVFSVRAAAVVGGSFLLHTARYPVVLYAFWALVFAAAVRVAASVAYRAQAGGSRKSLPRTLLMLAAGVGSGSGAASEFGDVDAGRTV